jgi:hypothetical protein
VKQNDSDVFAQQLDLPGGYFQDEFLTTTPEFGQFPRFPFLQVAK